MRMNVAGVTAIGTREAYSQISGAVRAFARAALLCGSVKRRAQNHLGQLLRGFYFIESAWALQRRWQSRPTGYAWRESVLDLPIRPVLASA
jgi:hypothetical protein